MKVSTDAVILGALARHSSPGAILDIGSGTGVISLMLAQRYPNTFIDAVEIDEAAAKQAVGNSQASPWRDRVQIHHVRFQEFVKNMAGAYSLIVSNPPYFPMHNKSADAKRNLALHNDELSFGDLIKGVVKLLDKEGVFWVILPAQQMLELDKVARFFGLYTHEWYALRDRPSTKVLRHIKAYSFAEAPMPEISTICIKKEDFSYGDSYRCLLKDFLLVF